MSEKVVPVKGKGFDYSTLIEETVEERDVPEKEMPEGVIAPGVISIPAGLNTEQKAAYLKSIGSMSKAESVKDLDSEINEISDKLNDKLCK